MIYSEFFSWLIDEISFLEIGIKPIEAVMWITFLILTLLAILNPSYITKFIDFSIGLIVSVIVASYFVAVKSTILK